MKNIVICCDGTNNQFSGDHTNVIRTFKVAVENAAQTTYYDPGVGTLPQPGVTGRLEQTWSILCGLAFGTGFIENVEEAYRYLMRTYEDGDKVYVFGFSRGAYTARALAGMVHAVGLLGPGAENLIRYAVTYWRNHGSSDSPGAELCREFKRTMARECPIEFIGVWDTVGSVGWINNLRTFPFTYRNPSVNHVRHAVSIDERRCMFRQNPMVQDYPNQDVKNVWFAGVHADVGGGYPARESGLAKVAFEWLITEAEHCGLIVDDADFQRELNETGEGPNVQGQLHRSLTLGWWLVELLPIRRYSWKNRSRYWTISLGRRRTVLASASEPTVSVHESVVRRMESLADYRPPNLPGTVDELKTKFRIEPLVARPPAAAGLSGSARFVD